MEPDIHFHTRLFDVSLEPENPINPMRGHSLLEWLRERVPAQLDMTDPDAEDWGWYAHVNWEGRTYMVGAAANESEDGNHEWVLSLTKHRSLKERVLGKARMLGDDPCLVFFRRLIAGEPDFQQVSLQGLS
ncbi:hypothetical protein [Acidovorax sp.]|uniref:hypothetical protein n=1 Tax=Acidovorax sp. TaxID=1872122 RepID=UPI00391F0994